MHGTLLVLMLRLSWEVSHIPATHFICCPSDFIWPVYQLQVAAEGLFEYCYAYGTSTTCMHLQALSFLGEH